MDTIIAAGKDPEATIIKMMRAIGEPPPPTQPTVLERGEVLVYSRREGGTPIRVVTVPGKTVRRSSPATTS